MYSRALRRVLSISKKARNFEELKNACLASPGLLLARQQILPCASLHVTARPLSEERLVLPKDPTKRKSQIDADANKQIKAMMQQNPDLEKVMKVLELEINVWKQDGRCIPEVIRPRDWLEILQLQSRAQRMRFLEFLFGIEKKRENRKNKQAAKNVDIEELKKNRPPAGVTSDILEYRIGCNSMFRRITEISMNPFWKWNSLKALMWGNKIVFDFSYEQYMRPQEVRSCAKQIMEAYSVNRQHNFPFSVYLCNVDPSSSLMKTLYKYIPSIYDVDFPWTVTSKSFIEIFEKPKLVYLSGHTNEVLQTFDHNSIYIVGAFVDKSCKEPISLAKSKELGIRSAKLPIDQYLHFGDGSNKNLTLNQVMAIMLDAQTGDWVKAFDHVPKRKLFESRLKALERKTQKELFWSNINKDDNSKNTENDNLRSAPVYDFSYAARIKLRNQYNKG